MTLFELWFSQDIRPVPLLFIIAKSTDSHQHSPELTEISSFFLLCLKLCHSLCWFRWLRDWPYNTRISEFLIIFNLICLSLYFLVAFYNQVTILDFVTICNYSMLIKIWFTSNISLSNYKLLFFQLIFTSLPLHLSDSHVTKVLPFIQSPKATYNIFFFF